MVSTAVRRAEALPFRAGRMKIRGHSLLKAQVSRRASSDDRENFLHWNVDVVRSEDSDEQVPFSIFADLHLVHDRWFVGVLLGSTVELPPRVKPHTVPIDALSEVVRELYNENLWDAAAMLARQLAASAIVDDLIIARTPPAFTNHQNSRKVQDRGRRANARSSTK